MLLIMEVNSENVSVNSEDHEEKVKAESQNVSVKLEDQEEKVKVVFEDQEEKVKVEFEDQSMQMENESVVEKLEVKMLLHQSVVQAVESAPLVLALVDPSTGFCHCIADIVKVEEHVRTRATVAGGKGRYHCDFCNYSTKDKYLITRHVARIHEKTVDSKGGVGSANFLLFILQTSLATSRERTATKQFCVTKHQIHLVINSFD